MTSAGSAEYREWIVGAALLVSCAPALQASAPQRLVRCLVHPSWQLSTQQLVEETHHESRRQVHPRRRPPINSAKPVRIWKDVGVVLDLAVAPHVRRVVVGMDRQIYDNANTLTSDSFMAAGGESVSFLSSAIIILCSHPPQVRRAGQ